MRTLGSLTHKSPFMIHCLLTGRLQVRILFEEPEKSHLLKRVAFQCVYINYQLIFQETLEAIPWPLLIIDRSLSVHFYNREAVKLLEAQEPLEHQTLDQLISDRAILELVQRSIQLDRPVEEECTREGASTSWKVSVKPLTHAPHTVGISQQNITHEQAHRYFSIAI